jgi:hypothetical protein
MKRLVLIALGCCAALAHASTITYTDQVTASGSLGTTDFTNALVTLTLVGNTTDVTGSGSGPFVDSVGDFTVTISGVGTATFTDDMRVVDNQTSDVAGFGDVDEGLFVLGTGDVRFATYDLRSGIGPITDTTMINISGGFSTTAGILVFSDSSEDSTFTANMPEPGPAGLIGLGLAAILARRRLRSRIEA